MPLLLIVLLIWACTVGIALALPIDVASLLMTVVTGFVFICTGERTWQLAVGAGLILVATMLFVTRFHVHG